jgi:hypothetical protein
MEVLFVDSAPKADACRYNSFSACPMRILQYVPQNRNVLAIALPALSFSPYLLSLTGAMALTLGMANSVSVILLQVLDLLYLWFSFPNEDQISNIAQVMCAKCNLLTMILASLPLFTPEMPEWLSDFTLICCALGGTALSALNALLAPIAALCGLIWEGLGGLYNLVVKPISSLCAPCMQGVNQGMGEGLVSAAAAGVTDAAVEIAVDACEIGDGDEEGDENANSSDSNEGEALGVAVAAGAVGAGAVMGAGMISKARKTPSYDPDDPPAHVQLVRKCLQIHTCIRVARRFGCMMEDMVN